MRTWIPILLLHTNLTWAASWSLHDPCTDEVLLEGYLNVKGRSVGEITLNILDDAKVPYQGDERSVWSMWNTPVGEQLIDLISDRRLRAYGWCYAIDGHVPETMADATWMGENARLDWFFGYAEYDSGFWGANCLRDPGVVRLDFCRAGREVDDRGTD